MIYETLTGTYHIDSIKPLSNKYLVSGFKINNNRDLKYVHFIRNGDEIYIIGDKDNGTKQKIKFIIPTTMDMDVKICKYGVSIFVMNDYVSFITFNISDKSKVHLIYITIRSIINQLNNL